MRTPTVIETLEQLEDRLSVPTPGVVNCLSRLEGDMVFLGAGGKMGFSLARMAQRASEEAGVKRRCIAVSRFGNPATEALFHSANIETVRCDLMNEADSEQLPEAPNVVYMVGNKFGTNTQQPITWAINAFLPGVMCRKYRSSKIVAFSTGNVYPLVPVSSPGCSESDNLEPVGEYGMSAVGRERIFEYFSRTHQIPVALIRLNYACELRYGVLVDIAQRVQRDEPVDLHMGYLNTIWQGDANAMTLQAFAHAASPLFDVNVTGLGTVSVRTAAEQFGRLMGRKVTFRGTEETTALLSDASRAHKLFDAPRVNTDRMIEWIAHWLTHGGEVLGKPTHFETRDGKF